MYIIMPFIMALQYNSKWLAWPTLEGHFTATHTTATHASATATDASATNVTGIDATAPLMPLLTTIGGCHSYKKQVVPLYIILQK